MGGAQPGNRWVPAARNRPPDQEVTCCCCCDWSVKRERGTHPPHLGQSGDLRTHGRDVARQALETRHDGKLSHYEHTSPKAKCLQYVWSITTTTKTSVSGEAGPGWGPGGEVVPTGTGVPLSEGGIMSEERAWGGSTPLLTFCWMKCMARANCSRVSFPICLVSARALGAGREQQAVRYRQSGETQDNRQSGRGSQERHRTAGSQVQGVRRDTGQQADKTQAVKSNKQMAQYRPSARETGEKRTSPTQAFRSSHTAINQTVSPTEIIEKA